MSYWPKSSHNHHKFKHWRNRFHLCIRLKGFAVTFIIYNTRLNLKKDLLLFALTWKHFFFLRPNSYEEHQEAVSEENNSSYWKDGEPNGRKFSLYFSMFLHCLSLARKGNEQAVIERLSLACPTLLLSSRPGDICSHFRVINLNMLFFLFFLSPRKFAYSLEQKIKYLNFWRGRCANSFV